MENVVTVRPWAKAMKDPNSGTQDPHVFRCSYFMGLKKKPAPVYNSSVKAANSVDLNMPVQEFRHQVNKEQLILPLLRSLCVSFGGASKIRHISRFYVLLAKSCRIIPACSALCNRNHKQGMDI